MLLLALDVWLLRSTTGSLSSTTTTGNVMFRVQVYGLSNPETTLKVIAWTEIGNEGRNIRPLEKDEPAP
jgi:hypothetical protein